MYCKHFGLTAYPFEPTVASEDLFESQTLREAQARLRHLLQLRGISLLTGEAGNGKTTACRRITSSLHPGLYRTFYPPHHRQRTWTCTSPSPGNWDCPPNVTAPVPSAWCVPRSPDSLLFPRLFPASFPTQILAAGRRFSRIMPSGGRFLEGERMREAGGDLRIEAQGEPATEIHFGMAVRGEQGKRWETPVIESQIFCIRSGSSTHQPVPCAPRRECRAA
ncbi:hypothetical protein [Ectothiorhodospira marina]|uniref:AAA domain-containing protein n=1 Tax=Ectothiorhodospira marina TaxID=1396821 RepID=A0A1H7R515_9GAMM|nr:hypothetical protein [Ectothiorhodospira marina]SEL55219.1 hypothetical protein SAMN05444515_12059 [Ectothiorhodospira marina]